MTNRLSLFNQSLWGIPSEATRLPKQLIWVILAITGLPFLLNLAGVDFDATHALNGSVFADLPPNQVADLMHRTLSGSFIHTLLEWSAFCTAIFTAILAFAYFTINHDVTTPILGVTLLFAGCMDAFHTLAADRLIEGVADSRNLIPFTWAICRLCNALLTILGIGFFLTVKPKEWQGNTAFVGGVSLGLGVLAYGIIHLCATTAHLPATTFPDAILTRPWDVIPLILFIVAGIFIYPRFYRKNPSLFSHALVVSTIPNAATQLHMVFGSTALFDNHFNIAHFLKIIAYLVPLTGLILDYTLTQKMLQESETRERAKSQEIATTLQELQKAQTQLVQSEKMSSLGQLVAGVAHEINNPVNFIHGNVHYASEYIQDLLELVQLYQAQSSQTTVEIQRKEEEIDLEFLQDDLPKLLSSMQVGVDRIREIVQSLRIFSRLDEAEIKDVDIHEGLDSTLMILHSRLKAKPDHPEIKVVKLYGNLPKIECYAGQLNQVFMNILSNAIDALEDHRLSLAPEESTSYVPAITIRTEFLEPEQVVIRLADNGPGLTPTVQEQLFDPFFTTKPVGKGTGMGLSISYQIVTEKHGGFLKCVSTPGQGAEFVIGIPIVQSKPSH
ncbi:MAG: ATP-binding protein [Leptolyngbyaceae bacterium]|nr:ATP-binding protein [Leptolyngbyaceae bacterium]